MSKEDKKVKKEDWKEEAARKKRIKEEMRAKDKMKAQDSHVGTEKSQLHQQVVELKQKPSVVETSNPLFKVEAFTEAFCQQPLLLGKPSNLNILGQKNFNSDEEGFATKLADDHDLIAGFAKKYFRPSDIVLIATKHEVFSKFQIDSTIITSQKALANNCRNAILTTQEGLLQMIPWATHVLIGCSILGVKGTIYTSKGAGLAVGLSKKLGKEVVLVSQTYKLSGEMRKGREGLQGIESEWISSILTEQDFCTTTALAMLYNENKQQMKMV